jgi:hypothetical protein
VKSVADFTILILPPLGVQVFRTGYPYDGWRDRSISFDVQQ